MNNLIINTTKLSEKSITAHSRNAMILSKKLNIPLISTKEEIQNINIKNIKYFIISGAGFYPETAAIESEIRKTDNPKIIWINNDYNVSPNPEYARLMKDFGGFIISNTEFFKFGKQYKKIILNLNLLLYSNPNEIINKKYDLIYYGTYRPGRRIYFQKYFQQKFIYVSSSVKNLKKYRFLAGADAIWCDKLDWTYQKESLNLFKYSLYLEDEFTHNNYNHLANRFYESLHCNVVQFFDINCKNTIIKSSIDIDDFFFVKNLNELKEKINNSDFYNLLNIQKKWNNSIIKEKELLLKNLEDIFNA